MEFTTMKEQFNGTWLYIKTPDDYGKNNIIEFNENEIKHFHIENSNNFSLIKKANENWIEKLSESEYEFINLNRIRFIRNGKKLTVLSDEKSINEDYKFEDDYEKLNPTETYLTESEIRNLKFEFNWNTEKVEIKYNEILDSPVIKEINQRLKREGSKILLNKFNKTLFLSFYDNNILKNLIPIKYVDEKTMILYGFPNKPYEINCQLIK